MSDAREQLDKDTLIGANSVFEAPLVKLKKFVYIADYYNNVYKREVLLENAEYIVTVDGNKFLCTSKIEAYASFAETKAFLLKRAFKKQTALSDEIQKILQLEETE